MSTGFLESISPWASRTSTPKPGQSKGEEKPSPGSVAQPQQGGDHRISHRHRLSPKSYPEDCPPLNIRWFYAVDVWFLGLRALSIYIDTGSYRYQRENHLRSLSPLILPNLCHRRRNLSPFLPGTLALSNQLFKGWQKKKNMLEKERMSQAT